METTEGTALVYCEGAFNTPNGKTAHGLVRFTRRYQVAAVIDSRFSGSDAGAVLDGKPNGVPVTADFADALKAAQQTGKPATHFVIGLAPDGGRLPESARQTVHKALEAGLNVDSGLHDFLSDDAALAAKAQKHGVSIRDVRKPPPRDQLHFFSGKIEEVDCLKIALLGTDSAVGKRTTAWLLALALTELGYPTEMVGTGQTAWMQGARFSMIMDTLISDFISGEIEHAVWSAWREARPRAIIIEGQGSLMNPAYPGGTEILAAGRPDIIVMQHAPARALYDGFPDYPIHPLHRQIEAAEFLSGKPVVAVTLNHEDLNDAEIPIICRTMQQILGLPVHDVLRDGAHELAAIIADRFLDSV